MYLEDRQCEHVIKPLIKHQRPESEKTTARNEKKEGKS
jgi:hypothetical protein